MAITKIATNGYRGANTKMVYLPPGIATVAPEFSTAKMTVTAELADYLIKIDMATVIAIDEPTAKASDKPRKRAPKRKVEDGDGS